MFINLNELKGIFVDLDSFPLESDRMWCSLDDTVRLLFYSDKDEERLERLKSLNSRFATYFGSPISFIVKEHVIVDMLKVIVYILASVVNLSF